jgi:predicted RNA methylase
MLFSQDFYPTPDKVIEQMLHGYDIEGKTILEPSAGKGNIVDFCAGAGAAAIIACEKEPELRKLLAGKCKVISDDFLSVTPDQVSHIDMIVMNPPFTADERHILHAWEIAPDGCDIVAICNANTVNNRAYRIREQLYSLITNYGNARDLGSVFVDAERRTDVKIALVTLKKPGEAASSEFEGFFMEDEPELQGDGIMRYDAIRDLVNRYVAAVKIYDEQLAAAVKMNGLLNGFYKSEMAMSITEEGAPKSRNEFKKDLQKSAWKYVFAKMNMEKYATRGLKNDINKFVEQQTEVPFTMKNIYRMIEIVIGTQSQRMDRALLEVFDRITSHYDENRFNVEGWKTNSHYLVNEKFILPYLATVNYSGGMGIQHYGDRYEVIDDFTKALCYITGENYDKIGSIWAFFHKTLPAREGVYRNEYVRYEFNTWYEFGFFYLKGFKKGSMHFKFKDRDVWGKFNQHIARLKGFPLFEPKKSKK